MQRLAGAAHGLRLAQDAPLLSAWLQHCLLRTLAAAAASAPAAAPAGKAAPGRWQQRQREQDGQWQRRQQPQQAATGQEGQLAVPADLWKRAVRYSFSVRPSVLSPLHPLHREAQELESRIGFLGRTMAAHLKLAQEVHPDELAAHSGAPDPVAAALAARREALSEVKASFDQHVAESVAPCSRPEDMLGYYTVLGKALQHKDHDAGELERVLQGDRSVWDYWFTHFAPQYAGLPGLGQLEDLYQAPDEEGVLRQMAKQQEAAPRPPPQPAVDELGRASALGGRKTSTAKVYVWHGRGRVLVNCKPLDAYFSDLLMRSALLKPLALTGLLGRVDVAVQVDGGGVSGQAQAAAHGIAKALRRLDPALRPVLKAAGMLRRDPRMVERKKPGKAKARKSFAWVKR